MAGRSMHRAALTKLAAMKAKALDQDVHMESQGSAALWDALSSQICERMASLAHFYPLPYKRFMQCYTERFHLESIKEKLRKNKAWRPTPEALPSFAAFLAEGLGPHEPFAYEMLLDRSYFRALMALTKGLASLDQKLVLKCLGIQVDVLNLQLIWRAKQSYAMDAKQLYALSLGRGERLQEAALWALCQAGLETVEKTIQAGPYASHLSSQHSLAELLHRCLGREAEGLSFAPVLLAFHGWEEEAQGLVRREEANERASLAPAWGQAQKGGLAWR